jgi:hypothetical protein
MVGDFTTPSFNIPASPIMTLPSSTRCVWQVTVRLNQGPVLFKFVTDDVFDNPTDYGGSEAVTLNIPGGPHPTSLVSGTGTAIKVNVAVTGDYVITLSEEDLTWTAVAARRPRRHRRHRELRGPDQRPYPTATVEVHSGTTRSPATSDPSTCVLDRGPRPGPLLRRRLGNCFATVEVGTSR